MKKNMIRMKIYDLNEYFVEGYILYVRHWYDIMCGVTEM